jgi:hypothetical protein
MAAASTGAVSFPSGSWSLYFHDPADTNWSPDSYKKIGGFSDFGALWATLTTIGDDRFRAGMYFLMKDPAVPLWEHRSNIHGGSYCIKVPEAIAAETFHRYAAASILELATADTKNVIVGVTISPKKGFHILKIWNSSCKSYNKPSDLSLLSEGLKAADIIYRPHVDQKM